jgi:tRNA1Val (adenine37-N6)-methyltransferase
MKVGTDGVLLGAWASLTGCEGRILDVGTGTGLIALMAAQRTTGTLIDAIEIDPAAAEQARQNAEDSPWADRISIEAVSLQEFSERADRPQYDHILSNPPYFVDSLRSPDAGREAARHAGWLTYDELVAGVVRLLTPDGRFSVIFPYEESAIFVVRAAIEGLYCVRRTHVHTTPGRPVKRVLLNFSRTRPVSVEEETLVIENVDRNGYSDAYRQLTRDFYLYF